MRTTTAWNAARGGAPWAVGVAVIVALLAVAGATVLAIREFRPSIAESAVATPTSPPSVVPATTAPPPSTTEEPTPGPWIPAPPPRETVTVTAGPPATRTTSQPISPVRGYPSPAVDQAFVRSLSDQGWNIWDPDTLIHDARIVCSNLAAGASPQWVWTEIARLGKRPLPEAREFTLAVLQTYICA